MRVVLAMLLVTVGCGKKAKEGLPPAESWDQMSAAGAMVPVDKGQRSGGMGDRGVDPHAGIPGAPRLGGDDPHAGMDLDMEMGMDMGMGMGGGDPHAGMDIDMGMGGGDPHAGMDMGEAGGVDVTQLGIQPPDPNRK